MAGLAAQVTGAKVRIEVNEEGSYEGYVHHIDTTTKKLTLVKGWCENSDHLKCVE